MHRLSQPECSDGNGAFPLPKVDDSLAVLIGSRCFSTLDVASYGYWRVAMDTDTHQKATFVTSSGLYK